LNSESWGGFGNLRWGFFDQLYFTFGVRAERNPSYGRAHKIDWTPTNGVTYSIDYGDLTVKFLGSYGRATRPPAPDMRLEVMSVSTTYNPGSWVSQFAAPDLTPEYSRGPQGGVELYYGSVGSLTINRYRQTISDLIQRVPVDSVPLVRVLNNQIDNVLQYQYLNVAKIRQQGWEFTGSLKVIDPLTIKGTYSWSDTRVLSSNLRASSTYVRGYSLFSIPTHTGNVTATYAYGGTSVTAVTNYIGSFATSKVNELSDLNSYSRIKTYLDCIRSCGGGYYVRGNVRSDLAVMQRLTPWASATINVTNLGNHQRSESYGRYPTLGRQTLFGISLRPSKR
jgi:outer membrane cobalamin receptor